MYMCFELRLRFVLDVGLYFAQWYVTYKCVCMRVHTSTHVWVCAYMYVLVVVVVVHAFNYVVCICHCCRLLMVVCLSLFKAV